MIADKTMVVDGITYNKGEEIPDLGSWECIRSEGMQRFYYGLSMDVNKLPKYDCLDSGSKAQCTDTGEVYAYLSSTKTWYKLKSGGGGGDYDIATEAEVQEAISELDDL